MGTAYDMSGLREGRNDSFDALMGSADPPLVVLTTAAENESAGCLVGFHAQSSISPPDYCVWLSKADHTYRAPTTSDSGPTAATPRSTTSS
jgi:flavin reductase (DIM6/NTAB) family NADH-FMN oxidoreductase RutF